VSSSARPQILASARRLIAERGAAVSMAAVARDAGVSRQAVYQHFGSRANLFVALVREMDREADIQARCQAALDAADPVQALRVFITTWLDYVVVIQPVASMLLAARRHDADASSAWEDRMDELRAGFLAAGRRLGSAGLLRPGLSPAAAGELAWALTSVAVWEHLRLDRGWSARTTERRLTDTVVLALTGTL
jgi:AcrR family transcriptional regulator